MGQVKSGPSLVFDETLVDQRQPAQPLLEPHRLVCIPPSPSPLSTIAPGTGAGSIAQIALNERSSAVQEANGASAFRPERIALPPQRGVPVTR
jgi:hypothetical protein